MTIRNYKYGLRPPTVGRDTVDEQLRLAAQYRETLVTNELDRRAASDRLLRDSYPDLLECEQKLTTVSEQVDCELARHKSANKKSRRNVSSDADKKLLATLRAERAELRGRRKTLRATAFADGRLVGELQQINDDAAARVRTERAQCGCYWGTYLLVEQSADAFRKGAPPRHHGYRGEGRLGVQIQKGMVWDRVSSGDDRRLRIVHAPQPGSRISKCGRPLAPPGAKRLAQQYELWLRVGSDGRDPIWARWPMILHRPIPDGVIIKWCVVRRQIVAGKERWSVTLSLDADATVFAKPCSTRHTVGLDVGYRMLADGSQRIAYWTGSDGRAGELTIDSNHVDQFTQIERLQATRDDSHNVARTRLREWIKSHAAPDWLGENTETMHAWKRLSRLDRLIRTWSDQRFAGDDDIYASLVAWRKQERHLWQWQENLRDQLHAWRRDRYRVFTRRLASQYRTAHIEKLDLNDLHDVKRPADERDVVTPVRRAARRAALSTLIDAIKQSGIDVVECSSHYTTKRCHACGHVDAWDAAKQLEHECSQCGRRWDQDENAARNLLASGPVAETTGESLAGQPKPLSRFERFAAARKAKKQ